MKINKKSKSQSYPARQLQSRCRFQACTPSFYLGQTSSGTGAITTNLSIRSLTASNTCYLDCFTVGGRVDAIAALFAQYRVRRAVLHYRPWSTSAGVTTTVTGTTTTPSYAIRDFAVYAFKDSYNEGIVFTYSSLLDSGGISCRSSEPFSFKLPSSGWLWTTLQNASMNYIDGRITNFGVLAISFRDTSTTAAALYGDLLIETDLEFRFPNKSIPPVGLSLTNSQQPPKSEEKKDDPVLVRREDLSSTPSSKWFEMRR